MHLVTLISWLALLTVVAWAVILRSPLGEDVKQLLRIVVLGVAVAIILALWLVGVVRWLGG